MDIPKGTLIPIGGNEDKGMSPENIPTDFLETGILKRVLSEINGLNSRIEVITTASSIPRISGENYLRAFEKLGCRNVNIMHVRKREHTLKPDFIKRIKMADGIMFTGGDQLAIAHTIGGTDFLQILIDRYHNENFVIAGTSAGAMAMSGTMIFQGSSINALLKDEVKLTPGLGLVNEAIIDTHFMHRGRFGRLAQAVSRNPGNLGIGLGEDTGVVIKEGNKMETIGSGFVIIVDGHNINYHNVHLVTDGSPLSIENLTVHVLARGNCYHLHDKKFFSSVADIQQTYKPVASNNAVS